NPPAAGPRTKQGAAARKTPAIAVEKAEASRDIVVEGDVFKVVLSSQGGVVKSWILKKYVDEKGAPLDLVDQEACEQLGFPLSLDVANAATSAEINKALFIAKPSDDSLRAPGTVEFAYGNGNLQVRKSVVFGSGYEAKVEISAFDGQQYLPVG